MHINPQNRLTTGFWTDVANSAFKLLKQSPKTTTEQHNSPLWFYSNLAFPFRREWASKGYFMIKDIIDSDGELPMLTELHERTLKSNHLDYETLRFYYNT